MKHATKTLMLAMLAAAALYAAAIAQERVAPAPVRPFALTEWGGEVYVRGNLRSQKETTGSVPLRQSQRFFEEGLELRGKGYLYHPNLFEMFGMADLGQMQQETSINGVDTPGQGKIRNYNLSGTLLKEKPLSARLFGSSSSSLIQREFTTPVVTDRTNYGAELYTKGRLPMRLLTERVIEHETSEQRTDDQTTDHLRYSIADHRSKDRTAEFIWDREKIAEIQGDGQGGNEVSLPSLKDDLSLAILQQFGPAAHQHRVTAQLRWLDRQGFYPEQARSADVGLDLNHTSTLSTFYRLSGSQDITDTTDDRTTSGEAGFRKRIYQSLDITGRVAGTKQQFADGFDDRVGEFLDLNYRKNTGLGRFTSDLSLGREEEHQAGGEEMRTIAETVVLTDVAPVTLSRPNAIVGSIVVTNTDRTIVYLQDPDPDADYVLTSLGAFTQIARVLPTTDIPSGGAVLVTYGIAVPKDSIWQNEPLSWSNRLSIKNTPLSVFYDYRRLEQELVSGTDPGSLNPSQDHRFGLDFIRGGWSATLEHEIRNQVLSPPTVADRFRVSYNHRLRRNVDLGAGANLGRLIYKNAAEFGLEPGRDYLDNAGLFARLNTRLSRNTLFEIGVEGNRDRGQQNDDLARLVARLTWQYRQLDFAVEARDSYYTRELTSGNEQSVFFTIKRKF